MWTPIADLKGGKGDIGSWDGGALAAGSNLDTFYGTTASPYRLVSFSVALDSTANSTLGAPVGAKAGQVTVASIGSTASVQTWKNQADGREWTRGVFANAASNTPWFEDRKKGSKRVAEPLTVAGSATFNTSTNVGVRLPVRVPVTPKRWRVYIRNYNDRTGTAYTGALSFTGVSFGKGAVDAEGRPTGQYNGGKTIISGAFTSAANGTQWVSPWMDYVLDPAEQYILSYGYTSAAQNNHASVGGGWLTNLGSGAINTDGTALTATKAAPLDVWIAYEVDDDTPHFAYFGDSLTAGVSADLPVYDSWAKRHAMANGAFAQMYAHSGTGYSEWTSSLQSKFQKYTGFSGVAKPDRLYNAMGSNDLVSASVATMRARFNATVPILKSFTSSNMYLMTILPRLVGDDAFEANRKAWNEVLRTELPGDAVACYEAAAALEAPSGAILDPRWPASPTDIHLTRAGYARYAAALTSLDSSGGHLSAATVAALPAAGINEGVTYYVGSEKLPYFSNGTTWQPINAGTQGVPGPPGAGVPTGGTAKQVVRRNSANTTTEWGTLAAADVGLGNVDNTTDAAKPISGPTQIALDARTPDNGKKPVGKDELAFSATDRGVVSSGTLDNSVSMQQLLADAKQEKAVIPKGNFIVDGLVASEPGKLLGNAGPFTRFQGGSGNNIYNCTQLKGKTGATAPMLKVDSFGFSIEDGIVFHGNDGAQLGLQVTKGFQFRLRHLQFVSFAQTAVDFAYLANAVVEDLFVDNSGSATKPAVIIRSNGPGQRTNNVRFVRPTVERSGNTAFAIGTVPAGETPDINKHWAEWVFIESPHPEAPLDNGGVANTGPLYDVGNVRHVEWYGGGMTYGGPGPLIRHNQTLNQSWGNGHLVVRGGSWVGSDVGAGAPPTTHLFDLVAGDGFTITGGAQLDRFTVAAIRIGPNYGENVTIDPSVWANGAMVEDLRTGPRKPLYINGELKVLNGPLTSAGGVPTIAAGGNNLSAPTSITGTHLGGRLFFGTGPSVAAGIQAKVTFARPFATAPVVSLTPKTGASTALGYFAATTNTGFEVRSNNAPTASNLGIGTHQFDFAVLGIP